MSVWNAPLDASTRQESIPYLVSWVEDYCEDMGNSPCTGIADRAVGLCLEARDCHPGLLVPVRERCPGLLQRGHLRPGRDDRGGGVEGRVLPHSCARTADSRRLLEAFLSTMEVWPELDADVRTSVTDSRPWSLLPWRVIAVVAVIAHADLSPTTTGPVRFCSPTRGGAVR